jgi:hypothetical protein
VDSARGMGMYVVPHAYASQKHATLHPQFMLLQTDTLIIEPETRGFVRFLDFFTVLSKKT